ncbi:hypothetical protein AVEN_158319-1 [Araneus ventricosus]|uniref:Transmembrane protein n=1 Tax=Araneus ventricosus TaxID=182803 RepID=A0A4Y2GQ47_ARAVE|nr:hypothetical protein AVEN_158319-1 [Araneus ventricosus]
MNVIRIKFWAKSVEGLFVCTVCHRIPLETNCLALAYRDTVKKEEGTELGVSKHHSGGFSWKQTFRESRRSHVPKRMREGVICLILQTMCLTLVDCDGSLFDVFIILVFLHVLGVYTRKFRRPLAGFYKLPYEEDWWTGISQPICRDRGVK